MIDTLLGVYYGMDQSNNVLPKVLLIFILCLILLPQFGSTTAKENEPIRFIHSFKILLLTQLYVTQINLTRK